MNVIERLFAVVLIIVIVFGFAYLLFEITSFEEPAIGAAVVDYPAESVKFSINNDIFVMNELEDLVYRTGGKQYRVTLININTENQAFCQVIVDGEITNKLHIGESDSVLGLKIKIGEIYT